MSSNDLVAGVTATAGNVFAWIAQSEQIWFPVFGAYAKYISPMYNLPDLRGPLAFLTLAYIGLRIGDLLDKRNEVDDTL